MDLVTDLKHIEMMAKERDEENWAFRTFLKQLDIKTEELDAIVHQITAEVSSQIDCTKCANCCKQISPVLDNDDILKLVLSFKTPVPDFQGKYLTFYAHDHSKRLFNKAPCPFLKDNLCLHYECRPKDCRSYPHLHKEEFIFRLWNVVENYAICPIVFNVYERLKIELWRPNGLDEDDFFDDIWI